MEIDKNVSSLSSYRFSLDTINTLQKQLADTASHNLLSVSDQLRQSAYTIYNVLRMSQAVASIKPKIVETLAVTSSETQVSTAARTGSASSVGLSGTATSTTIQSTEEVNSATTSYSTHGPDWSGSSTAQATISGEYDGSNGSDTLRFEVAKGGTRGGANLLIDVYDSSNTKLETITIGKFDPVDQQYTLSNGLVVSLGNGDLVKGDTFTLEVSDSVGTAVDPDKAFNGTGLDDPSLESGLSVTSGSFQINGVSIDVMADDTINTVLDRINQSDAGVTASFDAASETVVLTQKTPGSTHDIALDNDTSGFLAAVKLDGATAVFGQDSEAANPVTDVASLSSVQSGTISINGVNIDIDVDTDSLTDVLDRITASAAGVSASYNSSSNTVSLVSNNTRDEMTLDSGATGFFSALQITDGTYSAQTEISESEGVSAAFAHETVSALDGSIQESGQPQAVSATNTRMLSTLVNVMSKSMNALFDDSALASSPVDMLESVRTEIYNAVAETFDSEGPQFNTDVGINLDFNAPNGKVFQFSQDDQQHFESAMATAEGRAVVSDLFLGSESEGLLDRIHAALSTAGFSSETEGGSTGLFVDIFA